MDFNFILFTMPEVRTKLFGSIGVFPPTEPMHLISTLSLWAGYALSKTWGVCQLPNSTKWRSWFYKNTHTKKMLLASTINASLQTAGQTKNMGDTISRSAHVMVSTLGSHESPKE
jgi:hypothetical protein